MEKGTPHVGMDVHKRSIVLAVRGPEGAVSSRSNALGVTGDPRDTIVQWRTP